MTTPLRAGARLSIGVPPSGPLYDGHFPGRPILPGIGLLALVLRSLAGAGAPAALREIAALRLRRLVVPGEDLEIEVHAADPGGRVRLEVRRGAEAVASGILVLGEPSSGTAPATSAGDPAQGRSTPDLDNLLPHRPPMRFVEAVEKETDEGVVCAVRVPERCAFADGGSVPALCALEMAAQSAAVFEALRRHRESERGGPRIGFLVGARDVLFARARIPTDRTHLVSVRLSGLALPLTIYEFEIASRGEVVASGTVSTWLTATDA